MGLQMTVKPLLARNMPLLIWLQFQPSIPQCFHYWSTKPSIIPSFYQPFTNQHQLNTLTSKLQPFNYFTEPAQIVWKRMSWAPCQNQFRWTQQPLRTQCSKFHIPGSNLRLL